MVFRLLMIDLAIILLSNTVRNKSKGFHSWLGSFGQNEGNVEKNIWNVSKNLLNA